MFSRRFDRSRFSAVGATVAAGMLILAGCAPTGSSRGDDKAGGAADPVVLKLANTSIGANSGLDRHPALQYFVDRVKELSDGALRIEVAQGWGNNAPESEQLVVHDVAAGTIDLGSVGTHVFDTVGVTVFQALTAPLLIDNYPLQQAVLASDIPAEMLAGLDTIGLDGIAVLGDGLRKPIAVAHPLLGPVDYQGITFEAFRSQNHADAIEALGATPIDVLPAAGLRNGTIDGFEKGLLIDDINDSSYVAPYVAANVNLWPHTLALIANPHTMADLTQTERNWLTQAGADAESRSTDLNDDDHELVVELCESGARFANASDAELEAMRQAFAPVYATLDNDPTTRGFIDRINKLKESTDRGAALEIPPGCTGQAAPTPTDATVLTRPSSDALDGTYRWTITKEDALAHGTANDKKPENLATYPNTFTITMNDGTWNLRHRAGDGDGDDGGGSYTVDDAQVVFDWGGNLLAFTYAVDGDGTLHLDPQLPMDSGDQFIWATNPWTKIADADGSADTAAATPLDGTYRWTITKDDALAHGTADDKKPETLATFPWVFTMTLKDGTIHGEQRDSDGDHDLGVGTYTVNGDQITVTWQNGSPTSTVTFSIDSDGTLHLVPVGPWAPGDVFVTTTKPWDKID